MPEGSNIINIGYSGMDNVTAAPDTAAYSASKSALLVLTKSYAHSLGPKKIRVNMISPGALDNTVDPPPKIEQVIPLGFLGRCAHIADALEFLISDKAEYISGINLDVAGGYMTSLRTK